MRRIAKMEARDKNHHNRVMARKKYIECYKGYIISKTKKIAEEDGYKSAFRYYVANSHIRDRDYADRFVASYLRGVKVRKIPFDFKALFFCLVFILVPWYFASVFIHPIIGLIAMGVSGGILFLFRDIMDGV